MEDGACEMPRDGGMKIRIEYALTRIKFEESRYQNSIERLW